MYQQQGQLAEFDKLKPTLTAKQIFLMQSFNRLSQERKTEQGAPFAIREKDIHYYMRYNGSGSYPDDLFIFAIHEIDSEYIKMRCEEIKRKTKA